MQKRDLMTEFMTSFKDEKNKQIFEELAKGEPTIFNHLKLNIYCSNYKSNTFGYLYKIIRN